MGIAFGLMTSLSIGLADLFGRRVVNARGPVAAGVVMQLLAIVTSLASVALVVDSAFSGRDLAIGLASGLGLGVGLWGYFTGLQRSSSAVVAPIVATLSAVVPYLYAVGRGADPTVLAVLGALAAVAGLVLITIGGGRVEHLEHGVKWGIISGCGYGFGLSIVIEAADASGSWPAVGQRITAFVLMLILARALDQQAVPPAGLRLAAIVAGVLAGCSTIFFLIGLESDTTATVVTASLFPAVSVVVGRVVYGDTVLGRQIAGIGVVLVGVILVAIG